MQLDLPLKSFGARHQSDQSGILLRAVIVFVVDSKGLNSSFRRRVGLNLAEGGVRLLVGITSLWLEDVCTTGTIVSVGVSVVARSWVVVLQRESEVLVLVRVLVLPAEHRSTLVVLVLVAQLKMLIRDGILVGLLNFARRIGVRHCLHLQVSGRLTSNGSFNQELTFVESFGCGVIFCGLVA